MRAGSCPAANPVAANRSTTPRAASSTKKPGSSAATFTILFSAAGKHKLHHVFLADLDAHAIAHPSQEIAHCAWFDREAIGSIDSSRPTPILVERAWNATNDARLAVPPADRMHPVEAA